MASELDAVSRKAFGMGLVLDTLSGGTHWSFRLGEVGVPFGERPSEEYLQQLRALPLLDEQGDGVRSFIGLMLTLIAGHKSITLIDEPEAFLHPPQARFLGKLLSQRSENDNLQIVLSTHSSDIVHGVLEGPSQTTVVRLTRDGVTNHASVIRSEDIKDLWSDPLLRYSNLLEGLFSDATFVCEDDSDCRFFSSIQDTLETIEGVTDRQLDVLFTHTGGKHRMYRAVDALKAASVPVAVIGDFDLLNDWPTLSRLIKSQAADPAGFERNWRILDSALGADVLQPTMLAVREAMRVAMDSIDVPRLQRRDAERLKNVLLTVSGWEKVKRGGLAAVPSGGPYNAAMQLVTDLAAIHIHVIPVGEIENFLPAIGGHGPEWVSNVFAAGLHETPSADGAREFLRSVLNRF
jgi:hypothetical protein